HDVTVTGPPGPFALNSQIPLTAAATCTGGSPQYRFTYSVNDPNAADVNVEFRGWDASPSSTWNTAGRASGSYNITAWTRNAANTSTYEATGHLIVLLGNVCNQVSLTASPSSPAPVGTDVVTSSLATCIGNVVPQYRLTITGPNSYSA